MTANQPGNRPSLRETNLRAVQTVEQALTTRGAVVTRENVRGGVILLHTSAADRRNPVTIQVKSRRKGNWHSTAALGAPTAEVVPEQRFWAFVHLTEAPRCWIVPDRWLRNDIYYAHQRYLQANGGKRPVTESSLHHSVEEYRLEQWLERWDVLGIWP